MKPGRQECFESYVSSELAEQMTLCVSQNLIEEDLFGPGPRHPQLAHRVGDYTLLLKENYMIKDRLPGEHDFELIGLHGGLSPDELHVPLIFTSV